MNALFFAIQFLTRIPVPVKYTVDDDVQRRSYYWHGAVGLIIGGILLLTYYVSSWLFEEAHSLIAAILLIKWVAITGALHLDGLGDSADAWLGGYGDKAKTLAIMKDPTSGPAAIVWIVLVLLLKFAALTTIVEHGAITALIAAPVIARLAGMILLMSTPYQRDKGLATPLVENINKNAVYIQVLLATGLIILVGGANGFYAILLASACGFYARHLMMTRIQGTTGDTTGALIEWAEAISLLGFTICIAL